MSSWLFLLHAPFVVHCFDFLVAQIFFQIDFFDLFVFCGLGCYKVC